MNYTEVKGDLIELAKKGEFDVIAHGCNCHCVMGAGIAPQMARAFNCNNYSLEHKSYAGKIDKLGRIEYHTNHYYEKPLIVVNAYTQYNRGTSHIQLDYDALILCLRKINHVFKGKKIGLPKIGAGLAGGDWSIIKGIIKKELKDCQVTVILYEKEKE